MALPGMGDYDSDGDGGGASKAAPAEASPPAPPGEDFGPPPTHTDSYVMQEQMRKRTNLLSLSSLRSRLIS